MGTKVTGIHTKTSKTIKKKTAGRLFFNAKAIVPEIIQL
jgi:hypothetical protein